MNMYYVLMLGLAVSIDGFAAGMAYGLRSIIIPLSSLLIVGLITFASTGLAMLSAYFAAMWIDSRIAVITGSAILILIGTFSMFQEYLTRNVPTYQAKGEINARSLTSTAGRLICSIVAKPESADVDRSKTISALEAVFLGLALGIDNMIATFASALMQPLPLYTPIAMSLIQMAVVSAGCWTSTRLSCETIKKRVPYLPGAMLILLGLFRLR